MIKKTMEQILSDKWTQYVAMTTTVFAVCAAISTLKSGSMSTRMQLVNTRQTSQWSYFQAKSIKEHSCDLEKQSLEVFSALATDPKIKEMIAGKIKVMEEDVARYKMEKEEIKTGAENFDEEILWFRRHSARLGMAAMFLQIAIMLNSVGAVLQKRPMWVVGMILGFIGMVYMLRGLFF